MFFAGFEYHYLKQDHFSKTLGVSEEITVWVIMYSIAWGLSMRLDACKISIPTT